MEESVELGVTYVNHTFTSHLAMSASIQPFAGLEDHTICEFPAELKSLAVELTETHIERDENGQVRAPDAPGLGMDISLDALEKYKVDVEIKVDGVVLFPM